MSSEKKNLYRTAAGRKFVARNSLLTDIFQKSENANVYHIVLLILSHFFIATGLNQYTHSKRVDFGFGLILKNFYNFDKAVQIWLYCFMSTCAAFLCFTVWANFRNFSREYKIYWDWLWTLLLILYYYWSFKITGRAIKDSTFKLPLGIFLAMETVRFLMKVHSFVRNNVSRVIAQENCKRVFPKFSNFLYFLFAPTLIYKDAYPTKKKINWKFLGFLLFESGCIMLMFSYVADTVNSHIQDYGLRKFTVTELVVAIAQNIVRVGTLTMLSIFAFYLHCLQNIFAELTGFEDRFFYSDWWNDSNPKAWLRKWNPIVEEWLYFYVYMEFKTHVCNNTFLTKIVTISLSFVVHDWLLTALNIIHK
ncbi:sterol O-acyltransferase 1-like [Zophobas morio]|uniref:sterol O-acyltransferase 1-like n=1 Tax=Zophobas morio TaxID=2755281 RepID=UPI003082ED5E